MGEKVRCFVALGLPGSLKQQLTGLIEELRKLDRERKVRWVRADGIHLTLKFLGEVDSEHLPAIISATSVALSSEHLKPFSLLVNRLGMFPRPDMPRVIWVGLEGDLPLLTATQKAVEEALDPVGFPPENRPFSPHLTLGRIPDIGKEEKLKLGRAIQSFSGKTGFGSVHFEEAVLMESILKPEGAIYRPLHHFKLGNSFS